jgi:hypothetical protein
MSLQAELPVVSGNAQRADVQLIFSRGMILLIALAIVSPGLLMVYLFDWGLVVPGETRSSPGSSATANAASLSDTKPGESNPLVWTPGKQGPWGRIETMPFVIDVPENLTFVPAGDRPPVRWMFPTYSKENVLATLRSLGVPKEEVEKLAGSAQWSREGGVTCVEPGDRMILSLSPEVRAKLYAILARFPQNGRQLDPIWFRPGAIDWRLGGSGLAPESVSLLKRLLYAQDAGTLLFADFEPALRSLPNEAERTRFVKAVLRKPAVLARVRLDPDTDIEELSQYWGIGGRRRDLLPFLSAVHRADRGCHLNVACLVPNFVSDHLYRHPVGTDKGSGVTPDCFWSAFNFFNDPPDNNTEESHSLAGLSKGYYRISVPNQLGDLLILTSQDGSPVHAASFLADDIYFTKNGVSLGQPWILMRLSDLLETYNVQHPGGEALVVHYFRRNGF